MVSAIQVCLISICLRGLPETLGWFRYFCHLSEGELSLAKGWVMLSTTVGSAAGILQRLVFQVQDETPDIWFWVIKMTQMGWFINDFGSLKTPQQLFFFSHEE